MNGICNVYDCISLHRYRCELRSRGFAFHLDDSDWLRESYRISLRDFQRRKREIEPSSNGRVQLRLRKLSDEKFKW